MNPTRYLALVIALVAGLWWGMTVGEQKIKSPLLQNTYFEVCRLVNENYFEASDKLTTWVDQCHKQAAQFPVDGGLPRLMTEVEYILGEFPVSHLSVWDPTAMRSQWLGEARETGMRVKRIEDHWIVTRLVRGSPAVQSGIELGDEILQIDSQKISGEWDPKTKAGRYKIWRKGKEFEVVVGTDVLRIDWRPFYEAAENGKEGVLTIPSFVPTYFEEADWLSVVSEFENVEKLVIDLRGNSGGNFAAMLRGLSPFFCEPTFVGRLQKPRKPNGPRENLANNLDSDYQNQLIERASEINLQTFSGYPCFKGPVSVLIDIGTGSSAEVFAQAFFQRKNSQIIGDFSAGEVVQAVWHPLPLGDGYALSIPDAMFQTPDGQGLEGVGVRPSKILKYRLEDARAGLDSWIQDAL